MRKKERKVMKLKKRIRKIWILIMLSLLISPTWCLAQICLFNLNPHLVIKKTVFSNLILLLSKHLLLFGLRKMMTKKSRRARQRGSNLRNQLLLKDHAGVPVENLGR